MRQQVQHLVSFFLAMFFDLVPEHDLGPGLMHPLVELEPSALPGLLQRPSGKDLGDFGYVFLRIAAVHAERMQLHEFAAVIFV